MKNSLMILFVCLTLSLTGCKPSSPEKHTTVGDQEYGVRINITTNEGDIVTLVCPKFTGKPAGSHGRECYIHKEVYQE